MNACFSQKDVQIARNCNLSIRRALEQVVDAKVNVMCHATVGNQMGIIKGASKLESDEMIDIAHKEGQVTLILFYASWCPHS